MAKSSQEMCIEDCNHNILHLLTIKLDGLWRFDQYLKDAKKARHDQCHALIERMRDEDARDVALLKEMLIGKCQGGMFK
jgi:hypothetical protein